MFTGLIETTGRIESANAAATGCVLRIATALGAELHAGDSVAVNGVCLTVVTRDSSGFTADVSPETLRVTSVGGFGAGRLVNLERPLRAEARLGGHFVLGHVDAVGTVRTIRADGDCSWIEVEAPQALSPLVVSKGSIALDGISLTVAAIVRESPLTIGLQIVPFTRAHTALAEVVAGDLVNLEADVLGKYVARLVGASDIHAHVRIQAGVRS